MTDEQYQTIEDEFLGDSITSERAMELLRQLPLDRKKSLFIKAMDLYGYDRRESGMPMLLCQIMAETWREELNAESRS